MVIDKKLLHVAMANSCMTSEDVRKKSGLPRGTFLNAVTGKSVRPITVGKIAKALGADVTEIIETE